METVINLNIQEGNTWHGQSGLHFTPQYECLQFLHKSGYLALAARNVSHDSYHKLHNENVGVAYNLFGFLVPHCICDRVYDAFLFEAVLWPSCQLVFAMMTEDRLVAAYVPYSTPP